MICFVQNLINNYQVEGVKPKDGSFIYGSIKAPEELCLDFDCTLISPKKYFLPPKEALLQFALTPDSEITPLIEKRPFYSFLVYIPMISKPSIRWTGSLREESLIPITCNVERRP